jgi:hypothetical protein
VNHPLNVRQERYLIAALDAAPNVSDDFQFAAVGKACGIDEQEARTICKSMTLFNPPYLTRQPDQDRYKWSNYGHARALAVKETERSRTRDRWAGRIEGVVVGVIVGLVIAGLSKWLGWI